MAKFLDEDIVANVIMLVVPSDGTYKYNVNIFNTVTQLYETFFVGRVFLRTTDINKEFYLNEVINNNLGNIKNIRAAFANTGDYSINAYDGVEKIQVAININGITRTSDVDVVLAYRYPNRKAALEKEFTYRESGNDWYAQLMRQGSLLPVLPYKDTTNFSLMNLFNFQNFNAGEDSYALYYNHSGALNNMSYIVLSDINEKPNKLIKHTLHGLFAGTTFASTGDGHISASVMKHQEEFDLMDADLFDYEEDGDYVHFDENTQYITTSSRTLPLIQMKVGTSSIEDFTPSPGELSGSFAGTYNIPFHRRDKYIQFRFLCWNEDIENYEENNINFRLIGDEGWPTGYDNVTIAFDYQWHTGTEMYTIMNLSIIFGAIDSVVELFKLADVEQCESKYYLQWQDRYGSFQCQPFDLTPTYSESFEYGTITNYKNESRHSTVKTSHKWKIVSNWVSKENYPYYESIFTSPFLKLYDATEDKCYDVNIVDSSYTEKTKRNNGNKLFNLELNLEMNKKQINMY